MSRKFFRFLPFWCFLAFFKFGAALHYSLLSPLGEKVLPLWIVGLLVGGGAAVQLLLDVPAGYILDRYGYLKFLKITTCIFFLAALSFVFGLTTLTFVLSVIFSTFGWLFYGPGVNAYILAQAPKDGEARFISERDVFDSLGVVFSSAVLPFVLVLAPRSIGLFLFVLLAIGLIFLFASPREPGPLRHAEKKIPTQHYFVKRRFLKETLAAVKKLNPASTILLLLGFASSTFYGIVWFVVPLVIAGQIQNHALGLGLGIFDFSVVVLGFWLGNLADKFNRRTLVFFGLLLFSIAGMILGFNFSWIFLLLGFLATSGDEMAGISLWSWLHALDHEHAEDGAIAGVINLFQDLGWAVGPIAAGVLYGSVGAAWTITFGALPIFGTWIVASVAMPAMARHAGITVPPKPHRRRHRG